MNFPLAAIDARLLSVNSTGDTSYWQGLVHGLCQLEEDFQVSLLSNTDRPENIPDDQRISWHNVPSPHSRLWSLWAFPAAAKKLGAAVCHTQYSLSPFVKKGITTIHDLSFFVGPQWFQPKDRFLMRNTVPASVRRAQGVIAVSETTKRDIARFIPGAEAKTIVTFNALGSNIKQMTVEEAKQRREKLGVTGPYLLTVSTRWPRKNMQLAVAAADLLPARIPHKLVLTGKAGWGDQSLGKRSQAVGYVSDEDLTALYLGADAYLSPSLYEGFGIPLLEAFACNCPVICSQGGSLPEVAGDAAMVVESWDPSVWSKAIVSLLEDSAKGDALRTAGHERLKLYSWKETAQKTLDLYRRVASL